MDDHGRLRKKVREAELLRDVPPEESLRLGFSLIRFGRKLREAADEHLDHEAPHEPRPAKD